MSFVQEMAQRLSAVTQTERCLSFRYDKHELSNFHWASWEEIEENRNFKRMLPKLKELLGKENMEEKK